MSETLVLAMRPEWLNLILDGKKTAEVRRTRPATLRLKECGGLDLFFYQGGKVHGCASVAHATYFTDDYNPETDKSDLVEMCRNRHERAKLTQKAMREYLAGARRPIVYIFDKVYRFRTPLAVPCRPQSWQYADKELVEAVREHLRTELNNAGKEASHE